MDSREYYMSHGVDTKDHNEDTKMLKAYFQGNAGLFPDTDLAYLLLVKILETSTDGTFVTFFWIFEDTKVK